MTHKEATNLASSILWTVLFIVLLVLKLAVTPELSWWWVFCPFWLPVGVVTLVLLVVGIYSLTTKR